MMHWKAISILLTAAVISATATQPAATQPYYGPGVSQGSYEDGYRDGYRKGYDDSGRHSRYNDGAGFPGTGPVNYEDANQRWQQQYQRQYNYRDDIYYRECRNNVDPGGVIAGALIGGILGNALGRGGGRGGATIAGVVLGGAMGAALTRNLDCEDRSYAYNTYYDGFNAGRVGVPYQWRNPRNGHYGEFRIQQYYNDPVGFRCANFTQQIWIGRTPQPASGRACQQPDGTWAVLG